MTEVPRLTEDKGVDLGSQLLAELLFTSAAAGFAYNEYAKHKEREAAKEEEQAGFFRMSKEAIDQLEARVRREGGELDKVVERLEVIKGRVEEEDLNS